MGAVSLRLIDVPGDGPDRSWHVPGNMWRDHGCWVVVLPNGELWYSGIPASDGSCWTVTGEAPHITVSPSIDDRDPAHPWHGWIRGGVITDAQLAYRRPRARLEAPTPRRDAATRKTSRTRKAPASG